MLLSLSCLLLLAAEDAIIVEESISEWYNLNIKESSKIRIYGENDMRLEFVRLEESYINELTKIMKRAFDEDTKIHLDEEKGGPDGYDNGNFLRKWGLHKNASSFCIFFE